MTAKPPTLLPWDSKFFGVRIARMPAPFTATEIAPAVQWADAADVRCLYALTEADDAATRAALHDAGFTRVDTRLTLEREVPTESQAPDGVRLAGAGDLAALQALARVSHRNTRFHADGHFDAGRCDDLYATWITRALSNPAGCVLVSGEVGRITGYLALELEPEARIGLVAVSREAQGHGVGTGLVQAALSWLAARGARRISVVTQGDNPVAVGFYGRCGFAPARREFWYHRWADGSSM